MEANTTDGFKPTGWYVVVHFGTEAEPQTFPFFLKRDNSPSFTANMENAELFTILGAAEFAADKVRKALLEKGDHPLRNRIEVLELVGYPIKPRED